MFKKPGILIPLVALTTMLGSVCRVHAVEPPPSTQESKYHDEVAKLLAAPAPAPGGVLMVGSSIFRKWASCAQDLAPLPVTNRGFGGSQTGDQLLFFEQIVPSSRASVVVWYCGSNDVNARKSPEAILQNTKEWIARTQSALPHARVLIVSVIRAPQKREDGKLPQVDTVNNGLHALSGSIKGVDYIDVNPALQTPAGEPVAECFVEDHLHLTPEGYRRMTSVLKPVVGKLWNASPAPLVPAAR